MCVCIQINKKTEIDVIILTNRAPYLQVCILLSFTADWFKSIECTRLIKCLYYYQIYIHHHLCESAKGNILVCKKKKSPI
jgi:hypothetical protein